MSRSAEIEIFTELAIAWVVILFRLFARGRQRGFGKLQIDDYMMLFAGCLYAGEATCAYCVQFYKELNDADMRQAKYGSLIRRSPGWIDRKDASKIFLAGWLSYTTLLWTLKTSILIFYSRLTENVHINNMRLRVRIGGGALIITYIVLVLVILLVCSPVQKTWASGPAPGSWCHGSTANTNTYTMLVFNILTDAYLIYLPIPVIWSAKLGMKRKIGLTALFAGALVTAVFGLMRCILIITAPGMEGASRAGLWSVRESCTAIIVTNIPLIYPYLNQIARSLRKSTTSRKGTAKGPSSSFGPYGNGSVGGDMTHASNHSKSLRNKKRSLYAIPGDSVMGDNESEEHIVGDPANHHDSADMELGVSNTWRGMDKYEAPRRRSVGSVAKEGIHVTKTVEINSSRSPTPGDGRLGY